MKVVQLFTREAAQPARLRRDERRAPRRLAHLDPLRRGALRHGRVRVAASRSRSCSGRRAGAAAAGTLYVFIDWMRRFFLPLRDLSAKYSVMQSSMASVERIFQLLDTQPEVQRPAPRARPRRAPARRAGVVEFDDVWFVVREATRTGCCATSRSASRRASASRSSAPPAPARPRSSSCSTRLYEPTAAASCSTASTCATSRSASCAAASRWCCRTCSCSAAPSPRTSRSARDEIGAGRGAARAQRRAGPPLRRAPAARATRRRCASAARTSRRAQRQLLSFARALAHGADVLVLDEATSAIDTETEALVQDGIHELMERQDRARDRAPPLDDPGRRPHPRAAPRPPRRVGQPRRAARSGAGSTGTLPAPVRGAGRRAAAAARRLGRSRSRRAGGTNSSTSPAGHPSPHRFRVGSRARAALPAPLLAPGPPTGRAGVAGEVGCGSSPSRLHGFKSFVDRTVLAVRTRHHRHRRPQRLRQVERRRRDALGDGRAVAAPPARQGHGGRDLRGLRGVARRSAWPRSCSPSTTATARAPPAFAAYPEIQVSRRLYRSGESEYLINKMPCACATCRTSSATPASARKGYTIVEQGHIAEIVSAKPEERRSADRGGGRHRQVQGAPARGRAQARGRPSRTCCA